MVAALDNQTSPKLCHSSCMVQSRLGPHLTLTKWHKKTKAGKEKGHMSHENYKACKMKTSMTCSKRKINMNRKMWCGSTMPRWGKLALLITSKKPTIALSQILRTETCCIGTLISGLEHELSHFGCIGCAC